MAQTPTLAINPVTGDNLINRAESTGRFSIGGNATGLPNGTVVTVTLVEGDLTKTYTTTIKKGIWTVNVTKADAVLLTDGTATVTATAGGASAQQSVVIDKTALISVGPLAGDDVLNAAEAQAGQTFGGSVTGIEAGQTVTVEIANGTGVISSYQTAVANGAWQATASDLAQLTDGTYSVKVTAFDKAGNAAAQTRTLVVDKTAALTINGVALDGVINKTESGAAQAFSGLVSGIENGQSVSVQILDSNGNVLDTQTTQVVKGKWSISETSAFVSGLSDGAYTVRAVAADKAGNTAVETKSFTVDVTAPNAPAIASASDDAGSVAGILAKGGRTDDTTPTFSVGLAGTGAAVGDRVQLTEGASVVGTVVLTAADIAAGTVQITSSPLAEGSHSVRARITDVAGNTSAASAPFGLTIDTTAPTAPAISSVSDNFGSATGTLANGAITDDATPTFTISLSGTGTVAGDKVQLMDGSAAVGTVTLTTADINAGFVQVTASPLDLGAHEVVAKITDAVGNTSAASGSFGFTVANQNNSPTGSVSISGTAAQGETLTASNTLADADGLGTISYQWQANGANIAGATDETFSLTEAEVGKTITVVASYEDGHGKAEAVSSEGVEVANVNDSPTGSVTITGTAAQGETLTASNTLSDADGLGLISYQWRANGTDIAGATDETFSLTEAEVGKTITVVASYTDGHTTPEAVSSTATGPVANVNDDPTGSVTITGTAAQGETLTASNTLADADGLGAISYQWKANGANIAGATGASFSLTEAEVGKTITVVASYTDGHSTPEAVSSAGVFVTNNGSNQLTYKNQAGLTIDGGAGIDTLMVTGSSSLPAGFKVDLSVAAGTDQTSASGGSELTNVLNFENVDASGYTGSTGLTLVAGSLTTVLKGGAADDTITYFNASSGILDGGNGSDTLVLNQGSSVDLAASNQVSGSNTAVTGFENVNASAATSAVTILGSAGANVITGGSGSDTLNGGGGADTLVGGLGDDVYIVNNAGVWVTEFSSEGTDEIRTTLANFGLLTVPNVNGVENLTFTGSGAFTGSGNSLANVITGGSGSDTLNGGGGADTLAGGLGDDVYIVNNAGVTVTEASSAGTDEIRTTLANFSLSSIANVENLTFTGSGAFTGSGNSLANVITGGTGNDTLDGGAGADALTGGSGNDTFVFTNFTNSLASAPDTISDFSTGNDKLKIGHTIGNGDFKTGITWTGGSGTLADEFVNHLNNSNYKSDGVTLVTITGGVNAGTYVLLNNGIGTYDVTSDAVIKLIGSSTTVVQGDFIV